MTTPASDGTEAGAALALANLERAEHELLDLYQHHMVNRPFGHQDLYLLGIACRTLANSQAFKKCVEDRNGLVAAALLRLQLDTVLRLYALYWVADPEDFAGRVFFGEQVDRLKAADGQQMKDRYLIAKIKERNPWVEAVYKNTSGLIHFSDRHIHAAIRLEGDDGAAQFFLGPINQGTRSLTSKSYLRHSSTAQAWSSLRRGTGSSASIRSTVAIHQRMESRIGVRSLLCTGCTCVPARRWAKSSGGGTSCRIASPRTSPRGAG